MTLFGQYLNQVKAEPTTAPPFELLDDPEASAPAADVEVTNQKFQTRYEAAKYLDQLLTAAALTNVDRDAQLWAWLTLYFFDQVCPSAVGCQRKVGEPSRYLLAVDESRRYYRHLLLGPYAMYIAHRDNPNRLRALLTNKLDIATSETYRLFIENPPLMACRTVVSVATKLYYDPKKNNIRRGAGSKEEGGCRRLVDFLQQLDCTYDLPSMTEQQLISYLPTEFHRFIPRQMQLIE
jgi:hypothetical protein